MSSPGIPPDASDERLLRLVERASGAGRALRRLLADHAAAASLSDAELLVVWLSGDRAGQGMVQGDLAAAIGVSPALMSGLVERLRQRGLIEVQRSAVDRRRQVWRTTEQGRQILAELRPHLARAAALLDRQLPVHDQVALLTLCEQLTAATASLSSALADLSAVRGAAA
jgi:DNA-binding MarR family transcriptional regulator